MLGLLSVLTVVAVIASIVGWLWIVVLAFSDGETLWGIGSLIIPLVAVIYGILNYGDTKMPMILLAGGFVARIILGVVGVMLTG